MANLLDSYWPYLAVALLGLATAVLVFVRGERRPPLFLACAGLVAGSAVLLWVAYEKRGEMVPGPAAERIAGKVADAWFARLESGDVRAALEELWRSPDRAQISGWLAARSACLGKGVSREMVGRESLQYAPGRPLVRLHYQSRYERGPAVREALSIVRAPSGWGVASYYLEPPPAAERTSPALQALEKCFEARRGR